MEVTAQLRTALAARRAAKMADHLPGEEALLRASSVDMIGVEAMLQANLDDYAEAIRSLRRQSLNDPLATELDQIYRDGIEAQLARNSERPGVQLEQLACGLRLCMGSLIETMAVDASPKSIGDYLDQAGLPVYALVDTVTQDGGVVQYRFVMTIDPDSRAIVSPPGFIRQPSPSDDPGD